MKREEFEKLSTEHKFMIVDKHQDLLIDAVNNRQQLLPIIAGLSATLLVVATFNDKLIPLDNTVRIILSVLLIIIPVSLFLYNIDLKTAQKNNKEYLNSLLGSKEVKNDFKNKIIAYAPDAIIYILFGISIIIIYKVLSGICW